MSWGCLRASHTMSCINKNCSSWATYSALVEKDRNKIEDGIDRPLQSHLEEENNTKFQL